MKRAIILSTLLIISFVTAMVGQVKQHPILLDIGIVFTGGILLTILLTILKAIWSWIINSLTSILFVGAALIILGIMSWYAKLNAFVGFTIGLGLGAMFLLLLIRLLGKWAQNSMIGGEVFSWVSSYKPATQENTNADAKVVYNADYKTIMLVLKQQMGYPQAKAKEAANYALSQVPELPLEEKIRLALKYLGTEYKVSAN